MAEKHCMFSIDQYLPYRKVTIINKIIIKFTLCFCQLQLHFLVDFVRFGDG